MGRLKNMQDKVEYVLKNHPVTRDDDKRLICAVYSLFYNVDLTASFGEVLTTEKLPSFETIGRCRRKAQEEHEELRGKRDKERIERQRDFIEYATQGE